jgi:Ca2+-binding RTX toxin-like protein
LFGGLGDDTLKGGTGNDTMQGGGGADRFVFEGGTGADVVNGFSSAQSDVVELHGFGAAFDDFTDVQAAASQVGGDTVIDLGGGNSVTLTGILVGDLSASDFIFT